MVRIALSGEIGAHLIPARYGSGLVFGWQVREQRETGATTEQTKKRGSSNASDLPEAKCQNAKASTCWTVQRLHSNTHSAHSNVF